MERYEDLTVMRKLFVDYAYKYLPELEDTITKEQIQIVVQKFNLGYPQWITVSSNKKSKNCYWIPRPTNFKVLFGNNAVPVTNQAPTQNQNQNHQETDEEISIRIKETYETIKDMVEAVAANTVNSLVISGGAGLGKSFGVNQILEQVNGSNFIFHRGYIRATHLFRLLWENKLPGQVIVLDDVDIWSDEQTLNLLKAALELKTTRRIGWGSEKEFLDQDGETIPRYFDYQGSIIFLTNLKVREMIEANNRYSQHLQAIESRSLILDMKISSKREYRIAIKTKVYEERMLQNQGFEDYEVKEIMEFFDAHFDKFTEYSLRMIEKLARIYRAIPDWQKAARRMLWK